MVEKGHVHMFESALELTVICHCIFGPRLGWTLSSLAWAQPGVYIG